MEKSTIEAVLDMAIAKEEEAFTFYMDLGNRVADRTVRETLEFLAKEEEKHKLFLQHYRGGTTRPGALHLKDAVDYKIAEHLDRPGEVKEDKDAYLVAAHRELQSYRFYSALAEIHPEGEIKEILLKIAGEELKHKERVEYLYSNAAFPQTDGG